MSQTLPARKVSQIIDASWVYISVPDASLESLRRVNRLSRYATSCGLKPTIDVRYFRREPAQSGILDFLVFLGATLCAELLRPERIGAGGGQLWILQPDDGINAQQTQDRLLFCTTAAALGQPGVVTAEPWSAWEQKILPIEKEQARKQAAARERPVPSWSEFQHYLQLWVPARITASILSVCPKDGPPPITGPAQDITCGWQITWDCASLFLGMDFHPEGYVEWYCIDRAANTTDGEGDVELGQFVTVETFDRARWLAYHARVVAAL